MDYEKKYKEILKAVRNLADANQSDEGIQNWVNDNFPELKESEDERIRKALLKMICDTPRDIMDNYGVHKEDAIAWLEKQGEKTSWKSSKEDDVRRRSTIQVLEYARNLDAYNQYGKADIDKNIAWLERIGEKPQGKTAIEAIKAEKFDNQNYIKSADNVKPKFKVGDWVILYEHHNSVYQVEKIDNYRYYLRHYLGGTLSVHFDNELIRLWDIKDAKDGDLLASELSDSIILFKGIEDNNIQFYCDYDFSEIDVPRDRFAVNNSGQHYGSVEDSKDFHPATKEQRDTLMKAMTDAGYIFDFKKKELKKIEQKPDWGEEDEKKRNLLIDILNVNHPNGYFKVNPANTLNMEAIHTEELVDWLKSLKSRVHPKQKVEWSEEDSIHLTNAIFAAEKEWGSESYTSKWLKSLRPQKTV